MSVRKICVRALLCLAMLGVAAPAAAQDHIAERFITVKQGGKWGLLDQSGAVVLPFKFDFIDVDDNGDISLREDEKNGKADSSGRIFIPVAYSSVGTFGTDGLAEVSAGRSSAIINRRNEVVLDGPFSGLDRFDGQSLFRARYQGKWGVLSLEKTWAIQPKFFYIGTLAKNGLALAKPDAERHGFIDRAGNWVISPDKFETAWAFADDGLAPAMLNGKWGFINAKGEWIVPPISEGDIWPDDFGENGVTFVLVGGKYGLIDRTGRMVVPPQYEKARYFQNGMADVQKGGKWGRINTKGKLILPFKYDGVTAFHSEGLASAVIGSRWFIIDRRGRYVFGDKFDRVGGFFGGGWAPAEKNGRWGAINTKGQWLIQPEYDCVRICYDDPPPVVTIMQYDD